MDIKGKVVIVTGASSGIGEATARQFGKEGARLVLAARRVDRLEALAKEISALNTGAETLVVQADLSKLEDIQSLIKQTLDKFGRIDVLVNNAGMSPLYASPAAVTRELFDKVIGVNLAGPFRLSAIVGEKMAQGAGGSIINVSSIAAVAPQM